MTGARDPIVLRVEALIGWLLRDRAIYTDRELRTILRASFDEVTSDLRGDVVDAIKAHDTDVAKLGNELRDARDRSLQLERELARARDELDELRVLATNAIDELRDQLEEAVDVSAAALAALAVQHEHVDEAQPLCDGSGVRVAHPVVDGRVRRATSELPCPGCRACGHARREEGVRHG